MISFSAFLTELVHSVVGTSIYNFQPFLTRAEIIGLLPNISSVHKLQLPNDWKLYVIRVQGKSIFRLAPQASCNCDALAYKKFLLAP